MKQSSRHPITLFLALIVIALPTLGHGFGATPPPKKKQTRGAYRGELDRLLGENKVACKISLDCEALPLGVKPCGGPSEYIFVSKGTKKKISEAITDLTKTINEMDQTSNSEQGLMGTCEVTVEPKVACVSGSCQAEGTK